MPTRLNPPVPSPPGTPIPFVKARQWSRVGGFLYFLWVFAFTCVSTIICGTWVMLPLPYVQEGDRPFRIARAWASSILWAGRIRTEIYLEAPLPEGPIIFAANHQSAIDILALFERLPRPFVFVAKRSLFKVPFMGWGIARMKYIPVDRQDHKRAVGSLKDAATRVRDGLSATVFPEGTRSEDGAILPFKKGPFMLAMESKVPIVPVAVEGSLMVQPKRRWYVCPNTVRIVVGPPVDTASRTLDDRDALIGEVRSHIIRMNRRLGGIGGDETSHVAARGFEGIGQASKSADA